VRLSSHRLSQLCTWRIIWYCGPVLAGVCVLLLVSRGELTFTSDSVFYWSAAHTLLHRHELATGIAYDGSTLLAALAHDRLPPPLDPFTAFAPGYAVVLAAVAWCTAATVTQAALLVNVLSVVAIILLVAWLGRRADGGAVGFVAATMIGLLPFFPGTAVMRCPRRCSPRWFSPRWRSSFCGSKSPTHALLSFIWPVFSALSPRTRAIWVSRFSFLPS
jgi:hypothetical protein